MLVLASVPVHETSLANQHFYNMLLGRREGVCKKSTLCTLVKMLKIMDGPLGKEVAWIHPIFQLSGLRVFRSAFV